MIEQVFAALGDKTRLQIVDLLSDNRRLCITEIAASFDCSRQAVSRHLNVLTAAGILKDSRQSRERTFTLNAAGFASVRDWVNQYQGFWDNKLEDLKSLVEQEQRR